MMKALVMVVSLVVAFATPACDPNTVQTVDKTIRDVVSAAQFACIEATTLTDAPQVAVTCEIVKAAADLAPELLSFIEKLITRREMLRKSGYVFDHRTGVWAKGN